MINITTDNKELLEKKRELTKTGQRISIECNEIIKLARRSAKTNDYWILNRIGGREEMNENNNIKSIQEKQC